MSVVATTPPPTEEIRILCTTEQLAKVAAKAAKSGLTLEEYVNQEFLAKLEPQEVSA